MSEEVAQVLDRAREIIVERGWWQHGLVGPNGEICAVQAIWAASGHELVLDALGRATGQYNIANWNDAPGRTRRQVLLAFRRAAKAERAKP